MRKVFLITLLVLTIASPAMAASVTDELLENLGRNFGYGQVTWNNATGITATYAAAYHATTATLAVSTAEVVTVASAYGTEASMLTATVTGAYLATIAWASDVFTIDCAAAPAGYSTQETADCSGGTVSLGACLALIDALNCVEGGADAALIDVAFVSPFDATGYQTYGNAAMGKEAAGAVADSATPVTISADSGQFHDSALLDATGFTLAAFETAIESMFEGDVITVDIVDGFDLDLAAGFDDVANLAATSFVESASGVEIPMTAGGAVLDAWEEDRFTSVSYITASCNFTTACSVRIYDGDTLVWESAALTDNTRTTFDFDLPITATGSNQLKVQIYSADTIATVSYINVIGQN